MPSHPTPAWERLGEQLVRRRLELDPRFRNRRTFTRERAPKMYRIVNDVELGKRDNYEPATVAALEIAYELAPGAIERVLAGGELEPQPARIAPPWHVPVTAEAILAETETEDLFEMAPHMRAKAAPHLFAIAGLVADAITRNPASAPIPPGDAVFGPGSFEARRWDMLVELGKEQLPPAGFKRKNLLAVAAIAAVRDDERRQARGSTAAGR